MNRSELDAFLVVEVGLYTLNLAGQGGKASELGTTLTHWMDGRQARAVLG